MEFALSKLFYKMLSCLSSSYLRNDCDNYGLGSLRYYVECLSLSILVCLAAEI